jgi:hypothetical protein
MSRLLTLTSITLLLAACTASPQPAPQAVAAAAPDTGQALNLTTKQNHLAQCLEPSIAAERAASPPSFPIEWQGSDKWCPQSDMPLEKIYTRRAECTYSNHITLTADRYEQEKLACCLLSGHEGKHRVGRIYQVVMRCQGEHEQWFERADFFTPFPAVLLVVTTVARASKLADLDLR